MNTVLHYTGYDDDRGGIVSVVRALAGAGQFDCLLGVNPGAVQHRTPVLPLQELPRLTGEKIGPLNFWRARAMARAAAAWLRADRSRVFHAHSRAGLLVGLWLHGMGEKRFVVSVHCYGQQRWFYRWASGRLGPRLYWLSPAMRRYYGVPGHDWEQCIPGGVPPSRVAPAASFPGRLRLGGIGALEHWKNWPVVIEAIAALPPSARASVTFTHIGTGDPGVAGALRALVTARGLDVQIAFRGTEPNSDRLLSEVDALVIASRCEPFSMAMLEALAAGVPVLAADSGGAVDIIREGVNGRLHRTGDAAALAAQLSDWLARQPVFDVAAIRRTAVPIERVAAQWRRVYAEL